LSTSTNRITRRGLHAITISAVLPSGFTHPHLVAGGPVNPRAASLIAWPMQVRSHQDAEHHRPLLWAIATAELHDRIYQSSWRIVARTPRSSAAEIGLLDVRVSAQGRASSAEQDAAGFDDVGAIRDLEGAERVLL